VSYRRRSQHLDLGFFLVGKFFLVTPRTPKHEYRSQNAYKVE
jgi:hypothetical protein